jgi:hypothetical protein
VGKLVAEFGGKDDWVSKTILRHQMATVLQVGALEPAEMTCLQLIPLRLLSSMFGSFGMCRQMSGGGSYV